jgi:hypothetical protein
MNISLMFKWVWKLYQGDEGLWADLLRAKYLRDHDLFSPRVLLVTVKHTSVGNPKRKV